MFAPRSLQTCLLVVAFLFGSLNAAHGQADRGTITGQVTDQSDAIIPGASVKAIHVVAGYQGSV